MKMLTMLLLGLPLLIVVVLLFSVPAAWAVMLLLGAAHSFDSIIPALGFWPTFALTIALRIVTIQPTQPARKG